MSSDYDSIVRDNIHAYGAEVRHLTLLAHLYTDKTHFVFELLQNAEDALAQRVDFALFSDRLEVRHDGRPFNVQDVRGICGVGEGTKADDLSTIGRFGVGFKSVYSYTSNPEIHSGDEHFQIAHYIRPYAVEPRTPEAPFTTLFVFPFTHEDVAATEAFEQLALRLLHLNARTMLFLQNISEITWRIDGGRSGIYLRQMAPADSGRLVQLLGQMEGEPEHDESWLVFARPVPSPTPDVTVPVEMAFLLTTAAAGSTKVITPLQESPLVVFFPTEKETHLGFLIQGPYRTTPARDNIPTDDPWNRLLMSETATLVAETLPVLRDRGLLSIGLLNALPIVANQFLPSSMYRPIFDAVRTTLLNLPLLPTASGAYHQAQQVKLSRSGAIRELLSDTLLQQLYNSDTPLYWLPGEITVDREPRVHAYLRNELAVEDLTPEAFGARSSRAFLEQQSDVWFARFYTALRTLRGLWLAQPSASRAVLRTKPILRLEDGSLCEPFGKDNMPAAYLPTAQPSQFPTVKREIAAVPSALEFLHQLGLSEPDVIAELRELVLPRYGASEISPEQYGADLQSIVGALRTDSRFKRVEILKLLQEAAWVAARNAADGRKAYMKPGKLSMPSDELRLFFADNPAAWFVDSGEQPLQDLTEAEWRELGVAFRPRMRLIHPLLSESERSRLRGDQQSTRDLQIDDYLCEGLEELLKNYPLLRDDEVMTVARALWRWMRELLEGNRLHERQPGLQGVYIWVYYQRRSATFPAAWVKLLRDFPWLPAADGTLHRPTDLTLDDLPADFARDERLVALLDLGSARQASAAKIATLAEEIGISIEQIEFVRRHQSQVEELIRHYERDLQLQQEETVSSGAAFGAEIEAVFRRGVEAHEQPEIVDAEPVPNPERRRAYTQQEIAFAQAREPRIVERFSRVPERHWAGKDGQVRQFLLEQYQGICQMCGDGFLKRDGTPYFEGLYLVSHTRGAWLERPGNVLCLCATCCAKLQLGSVVIDGDDLRTQVKAIRLRTEGGDGSPRIRLSVCGKPTMLTFTERHILDLQEMLKAGEIGIKDGAA